MERIELFLFKGTWMARSNSPTVLELFETDTLPTAYTRLTDGSTVLQAIQQLNPNAEVVIVNS